MSVSSVKHTVQAVRFKAYTVATVPPAAGNTGMMIYVSNGAAGSPCMAFSDGTNWKRVDTVATNIAA
jgi:hypothetical protein